MTYPQVIPHSDAAGIIDAVGPGVDGARIGTRVWVFGAHRAVFGDGPVTGRTVLVQGVLGAVGSLAAQLTTWVGSDDFPFEAKQQAARDLTAAAAAGALSVRTGTVFPLSEIAAAHDRVDAGGGGRVLVRIID